MKLITKMPRAFERSQGTQKLVFRQRNHGRERRVWSRVVRSGHGESPLSWHRVRQQNEWHAAKQKI